MPKILTVRAVEAARPSTQRREIPDGVIPGLYLVVQPSGFKSWALRYRVNGRSAKHTIGAAGVLELAAARAAARTALLTIAEGGNPAAAKRSVREQAPEPFELIAGRFIERYAKLHNKSWRQSERILQREAVPRWRHRPITSITRSDVVALIDAIVDRPAPFMANRTLTVLRRLFGWCVERGVLEVSPCERVKDPAPETRRDRVHSDDELRAIWNAAGAISYPFGPAIKLLVLTGQRREEVAGMRWGEISDDLALWTLPAERVKNKTKHEVPLSPPAREILASLPRIGELVFTTTGATPVSGFAPVKRRLDAAISPPLAPWVLHDLRRSLASGMARLSVRLEVVEKILNHTGCSFAGVAGVYQRHDYAAEKRSALELWAHHILSLSRRSKRSGNVITLKRPAGLGRAIPGRGHE
jgi:integrase